MLNAPETAAYAVAFADAVGTVLDAGDVPVVLGVRAEDAVIVGYRDAEEQARNGSQPLLDALLELDLAAVRAAGPRGDRVAAEARAHRSLSR